MACPSTETLLAFVRGLLPETEAAPLRAHLDACAQCRTLVAEGVASEDGHSSPSSDGVTASRFFCAGATLGRYVVLERIGAGGMGVVYAARDPELNRRVALKLIRVEVHAPERRAEAQARLLREAQATARIDHPNVIAIHDVGRIDDMVFLAMDLVEGTTLGARMRQGLLPWREALELFIQAGRGLSAAHEAGLVHRDFKPDNVLIGPYGRVRITDFGLARLVTSAEEAVAQSPGLPSPTAQGEAITQTGTLLGTPGYMSPEQARGESPDARSDQFSFCVALYEALYGKRPCVAPGPATARNPRPLSREPSIPGWLHRAVMKGLSPEPSARHSSMCALIQALEQTPRRHWRKLAVALAVATPLVAVGAVRHLLPPRDPCGGAEVAFAGTWDAPQHLAVKTALTHSPLPIGGAAWSEVERALDAYATRWRGAHRQACEATRVQGRQTEGMFERHLLCLDQRKKDVAALVEVLSAADDSAVRNAVRAVHGLEDVARCADLQSLTSPRPPPTDAESQRKMEELRRDLGRMRARFEAGQPMPALELANAVLPHIDGLGYPPLEAEALLGVAEAQGRATQDRDAVQTLHRAIQVAEAARLDRQAAEGWVQLVRLTSFLDAKDADPSNQLPQHAAAAIQRLGGDAQLEAMLAANTGSLLFAQGKLPESLAQSLHAVELARKAFPPGDRRTGTALLGAGQMMARAGRHAEAIPLLREAEALYTAAMGSEHPNVAIVVESIAVQEIYTGKPEQALVDQRRALALFERAFGAESAEVASSLKNVGNMLGDLGHHAEAVATYEKAAAIQAKVLGPQHPDHASTLSSMGQALLRLGRHREAVDTHRRALAIREAALGPEALEVAYDLAMLGSDFLTMAEPRQARDYLERALRTYEHDAVGQDELVLADMRFLLAEALVSEPSQRARALRLANSTLDIYRRFPGARNKETTEVEQWLAKRH
ncbi:tetratricopeptide repeat protein [Myxococcaceae bacterium JPH2]|nr:tetratricopeptide repeat protein [Myxococcaceae bacterium JPH2]